MIKIILKNQLEKSNKKKIHIKKHQSNKEKDKTFYNKINKFKTKIKIEKLKSSKIPNPYILSQNSIIRFLNFYLIYFYSESQIYFSDLFSTLGRIL